MRRMLTMAGLALVLGAGCALNASAQVKPEVLVDQRIAAMRLQGKYLFPLVPMAQGKVPYDAAIVARNAGYLDVLIRLAWDGFDPGTQGVKSRTLPRNLHGARQVQDRAGNDVRRHEEVRRGGEERQRGQYQGGDRRRSSRPATAATILSGNGSRAIRARQRPRRGGLLRRAGHGAPRARAVVRGDGRECRRRG